MAGIDIYFVFGVSAILVSSLTIIGHSLTINAFWNIRSLRDKNPSNLLILALSITDLIFGIYVFMYYAIPITAGLGNPFGETGCMMSLFPDYSYVTSNLILVAISLDRVLLVSMDYSAYMKTQTKRRVKVAILCCVCVSLVVTFFEMALWNYAKRNSEVAANIDFDKYCLYPPRRMKWFNLYLNFGVFCAPVVIVALLSAVFLCMLRGRIKKSTRIGQNGITPSNKQYHESTNTAEASSGGDDERSVVRKRYLKPAITLGALVAAMAFSILPYCIYITIEAYSSGANDYNLLFIMWLIYLLNPLLDTVFYAATQRSIREYYRKKCIKIYQYLYVRR